MNTQVLLDTITLVLSAVSLEAKRLDVATVLVVNEQPVAVAARLVQVYQRAGYKAASSGQQGKRITLEVADDDFGFSIVLDKAGTDTVLSIAE